MPDLIYIEEAVRAHPRTQSILARYPQAAVVEIERYGEVFNRAQQDFRLQKQRPALILARKHDNFVLRAPSGYGIGSKSNYYFSHLLNCPFDCRYCFLQGMYRSAHHLLFVNYEDFQTEISRIIKEDPEACFFTGYDCDSLALEPVTRFSETFLPFFVEHKETLFELRTKSTHTASLLARPATSNLVVALSLTPRAISEKHEHKTPSLPKRLAAAKKLAEHGWPIGLRLDPVIYDPDLPNQYRELLDSVIEAIPKTSIHSISLGPLRFPKSVHRKIVKLYPQEALLAGPLAEHSGPGVHNMISYPRSLERQMHQCVLDLIKQKLGDRPLFSCTPPSWDEPKVAPRTAPSPGFGEPLKGAPSAP